MLEICPIILLIMIIFLAAVYLYFFGLPDVYRLWRILRPDEDPKVGLVAKDPQACKTVISHVNCGSREGYKSQYISTTASYDVALRYKAKGEEKGLTGLRIAEIDLEDLPETCKLEIVDLTTEENRDKYLGNAVCKNFAKASCEVLLKCNVPIPCHVVEEVFERLFRAMNFIPF